MCPMDGESAVQGCSTLLSLALGFTAFCMKGADKSGGIQLLVLVDASAFARDDVLTSQMEPRSTSDKSRVTNNATNEALR